MRVDVERALNECVEMGAACVANVSVALRVMDEWSSGFATGHAGSGADGGGSRTERLALRGPDQVDRDRVQLAFSVAKARQAMRVVYDLIGQYHALARTEMQVQSSDRNAR